jgi:hypothetical protein
MSNDYATHIDYMKWVKVDADARQNSMVQALHDSFKGFIEKREVEVIAFSSMSAFELAKSIRSNPLVLKPLLAACNIAARAIERDLDIKSVDTYEPKLTDEQANVIAGYIKPFLPAYLEIPALVQIDRIEYIDKEIRMKKGRWEKEVIEALQKASGIPFSKRKFKSHGEEFELDAATPKSGDVAIGIDVKRIEARRDIHKRCDEIVNKASHLKAAYPKSKFAAVVYYPFIDEHVNIQNRLRSENVDTVVFAATSEASIENAVKMLLSTLGVKNG